MPSPNRRRKCWHNATAARPPPPATVAELLELPQSAEDVWQLDVQRLPTWIHDGAQPWRPWIVFAVSATEKLIMAHDVRKEPVAADDVWRYLSGAITQPMMGEAHRPSVIEVSSAELLEGLRPRLAEINVRVALRDSLEEVDFAIRELAKTISADSIAALIDVPGVSLDMVGEFFSAAADYYRQMPWRKLPGDVPIQLTTPGFGGGVWYAVVMGQSGQTFGLAMYDDKKVLDDMLASDGSEQGEEENGRQMTGLSLMFGEAFEIAPRDLDAAERFGWPIAAPEAHPFAIWVNPGPNVRPPLAWELELITAALRAIPRFLADKPATPFAATVSLTSGERTVTLSWTE